MIKKACLARINVERFINAELARRGHLAVLAKGDGYLNQRTQHNAAATEHRSLATVRKSKSR